MDKNIDHTQEICPITKFLNAIPNQFEKDIPTGISLHQWNAMNSDYNDKGIYDSTITYGEQIKKIENKITAIPRIIKNNDGTTEIDLHNDFIISKDENGDLIWIKKYETSEVYTGFKTTYNNDEQTDYLALK